ncbi:acyltransferase [Rhodophyticola sp. CCM32]|uniref:acyltransferase n=1 Tax=Rhodophyticola sp. CCM32 TaxID=2916397 RepID=UPI00107FBB0B|nr:acyltransferase [Rhodophyticola sp. CCM32]QBY01237.1 acyltransferase [Rhodophyticola sp. CCM32]
MAASKPRLVWFDANRVCAALGVVLIHSTADFNGGAFPDASVADRAIPVFLRSIAEFSGSEMFFLFSLFLMAMRIDRGRPTYGAAIASQAQRLLVPFAFWTVFYAFFRLLKAGTFNYAPQYLEQLTDWQTWIGYFVLGKSQYHMHFLPTLFLLFLFYPVMRLALRYPILGLTLFATLGAMEHAQGYLWSLPINGDLLDYLIRAIKVMGYVGYGFAAFALYSLWKDGIPRGESRLIQRGALYFAAMAYVATLPFFGAALFSGGWGVRADWSYFGHFLMPVFMFCLFLGGQHFTWSPRWSELAKYSFGVYLLHPILIDLYDIALAQSGAASGMSPTAIVILRYVIVLPATFGVTVAISRIRLLAWTIGLGPAPWTWGKSSRSAAN